MVASLVRLLHSGPQDVRLLPKKGPTDVSAYVRVLTRAGRMTTQWSRIDFQQQPNFGSLATAVIPKVGELITRLYLVVTLPDIAVFQNAARAAAGANFAGPNFGWTNSIGHALIESITLNIGGNRVEEIPGRLLELLDEYNTPLEKIVNRNAMIGRLQNGFTETSLGAVSPTPLQLTVPLPYWFSRGDLGTALPIDAIHVDEVRVGINFRPITSVYYTDSRAPAAAVIPTTEGSALWPMLGSQFYAADPQGQIVPGLYQGRQPVLSPVSPILETVSTGVTRPITMPLRLDLGDTYLLAEYVYLDRPEANRFRLGDITVPVTQHYTIPPRDTQGFGDITIPLELANPTRHLYFMAQNYNAIPYNTFFLATKDLASQNPYEPLSETFVPWWPDCSGLNSLFSNYPVPGFSTRGSEPFEIIEVLYEGSYVRTSTANPALYRSILPSLEERKSPWINRYMYCIPFGTQAGYYPPSVAMGEANMNRIMKKDLRLGIAGTGNTPQRVWVYVWAETYNILRVFGGRAGLMFSY